MAYVTETVVNNVPKLDPQKDVVIDLSHKDASLDGKEVALHQTFNYRLVGAMIPSNRATDLFEYGLKITMMKSMMSIMVFIAAI